MNGITSLADWLWGAPMTIILLSVGLLSTVITKGSYIFRLKTHWNNTYGRILKPVDGAGSVSSFASACTAMANTIGTGNIAGVSTAIAAGGPGALVWMWVTGFLGCSMKAVEIFVGQRYRVKFKNVDEYVCDRSFAVRNAFGWRIVPFVLAIVTSIISPWFCIVQTESVLGAFTEAFSANKMLVLIVMIVASGAVIFGGLRRIASVMEKVVPFMAIAYILGVFSIMVMHYDLIIPTFAKIFYSAFHPAAAVGGFAGATVRDAMRYGVARGLFSNDAGTGFGIIAHSPAITDHPGRQASWGWGEVFLDTIVICTMSAMSILLTGVYVNRTDVSASSYVTAAFGTAFGGAGSAFAAIIVAVFAWTTIIGLYYAAENTVKYLIGDNKFTRIGCKIYMAYFLIPAAFFSHMDSALLWALMDILSFVFVIASCFVIVGKWREIKSMFDDFYDRYLPAYNRGEKPEVVSYATYYEKQSLL